MAEWSNAPDSKSGVQVLLYRGFESLSFRQDYFELIPSSSNRLQSVRASLGALLERFPDQTGFLIGLNVFEPVQDLSHDLQVLRALADGAPALKACD